MPAGRMKTAGRLSFDNFHSFFILLLSGFEDLLCSFAEYLLNMSCSVLFVACYYGVAKVFWVLVLLVFFAVCTVSHLHWYRVFLAC